MSKKSLVDDCEDQRKDCTDGAPTREHVLTKEPSKAAWYDYLYVAYSVAIYIADVVTDMLVSVKYFRNGDYVWFSLTVSCVLGASLVMMLFSLKWYYDDTAKEVSKTNIVVLHVLQLGPLKRYWDCYKNGKQSRKKDADRKYYNIYIEQWRDIMMLRLFEVFIESAPQMVLQLYILAYNRHFDEEKDWLTALSAWFSLISLSSSIVSYSKALRDASDNKGKMTWWAFGCQVVWRLTMVASRIVTLVLFASVYKSWILLVICLHWIVMTIWIRWLKPSFCPDNKAVRIIYSVVIGFIYVFCFFNVKDGFTRKRLVFFYTSMFVENCVLMVAWLPYRHEYGVVFVVSLGFVFGGFFIGVIALLLYYQCYHPSLATQGICVRTSHNVPRNDGIVERMICCNTCCPVRSYEDEESAAPTGSQLHIDIPVSRGSLRRHVVRETNSSTSTKFESEIFFHKPSELQRQYSLDKKKIKKEKAERIRRRHSMEGSVRNGAANSAVVQIPNTADHRKGAMSLPNSPIRNGMNELRNSEVRNKNGNVYSVEVHEPKLSQVSNGHAPNVDDFYTKGNDSCNIVTPGLDEAAQRAVNGTSAVIDPEMALPQHVDLNHNTSLVVRGERQGTRTNSTPDNSVHYCTVDDSQARKPCDDGVHCGTDDENETKKRCDDGVHCGTDDERTGTPCAYEVNFGADDGKEPKTKTLNGRAPCDDGVHCGTDDENEVKTNRRTCGDGIHCGTDDEHESKVSAKNSRTSCDDGVHCGTDDEQDTKTAKPDVTPSNLGNIRGDNTGITQSKTNLNTKLRRGDHVSDTCVAPESHVQSMRATQLPKYCDRVNFHHRYSIVSDCISLSSSTSSENEEDKFMEEKRTLNDPSWIHEGLGANIKDPTLDGNSNLEERLLGHDECPAPSNSLEYAQVNAAESPTRSKVIKRYPNQRTINRRSKQSNRVSFPNFVATNLKRGRFSSLRRSREDCTKDGEDIRRHTVDFSVLNSKRGFHTYASLTKTLKPKKFGSVRDELEKLSLN